MNKLARFLMIFIPTLLIVYGVVSKVVINARSQENEQGQEAFRQDKGSNFISNQANEKR
ncbi:MAG: hypothetical protein ACYTXA_25385 [Nostoc sp.]